MKCVEDSQCPDLYHCSGETCLSYNFINFNPTLIFVLLLIPILSSFNNKFGITSSWLIYLIFVDILAYPLHTVIKFVNIVWAPLCSCYPWCQHYLSHLYIFKQKISEQFKSFSIHNQLLYREYCVATFDNWSKCWFFAVRVISRHFSLPFRHSGWLFPHWFPFWILERNESFLKNRKWFFTWVSPFKIQIRKKEKSKVKHSIATHIRAWRWRRR